MSLSRPALTGPFLHRSDLLSAIGPGRVLLHRAPLAAECLQSRKPDTDPIREIATLSRAPRFGVLGFEEREQLGIDDVGVRRWHAVRVVLVRFQRAVLEELG